MPIGLPPLSYDPTNEVVRFTVKPAKTDRYYESLTIDLDIVRYDAIFHLSWENTQIHFPIATGTHEKTLSYIKTTLQDEPRNPDFLARASFYYSMNNEDPDQVLKWLDQAISLGGDRWVYHQKLDMLEHLEVIGRPEGRPLNIDERKPDALGQGRNLRISGRRP